ncbi:MAG TPA: MgtC/SapB family protein [Aquificaceae bacterium]|nr:MgtC/SapB family protein [Aquificaceae bacterium]
MNFFSLAEIKSTPEFKILFSLFLGFIIGLERELRAKFGHDLFAGVRTLPLISILGTISGILYMQKNIESLIFLPLLGLVILAGLSYWKDRDNIGITTEIASLAGYVHKAHFLLFHNFQRTFNLHRTKSPALLYNTSHFCFCCVYKKK